MENFAAWSNVALNRLIIQMTLFTGNVFCSDKVCKVAELCQNVHTALHNWTFQKYSSNAHDIAWTNVRSRIHHSSCFLIGRNVSRVRHHVTCRLTERSFEGFIPTHHLSTCHMPTQHVTLTCHKMSSNASKNRLKVPWLSHAGTLAADSRKGKQVISKEWRRYNAFKKNNNLVSNY